MMTRVVVALQVLAASRLRDRRGHQGEEFGTIYCGAAPTMVRQFRVR